MKDGLFEMLLGLFEKTLTQLKESQLQQDDTQTDQSDAGDKSGLTLLKSAQPTSVRVFTQLETQKLTKASYQLLARLTASGIVNSDILEVVMNHLIFSDSRFVGVDETKWAIRNALEVRLNQGQLAFLDLLLYSIRDNKQLH